MFWRLEKYLNVAEVYGEFWCKFLWVIWIYFYIFLLNLNFCYQYLDNDFLKAHQTFTGFTFPYFSNPIFKENFVVRWFLKANRIDINDFWLSGFISSTFSSLSSRHKTLERPCNVKKDLFTYNWKIEDKIAVFAWIWNLKWI